MDGGRQSLQVEGSMASSRDRKASVAATERTEDRRMLILPRGSERLNHSMPLGHVVDDADIYPKSIG